MRAAGSSTATHGSATTSASTESSASASAEVDGSAPGLITEFDGPEDLIDLVDVTIERLRKIDVLHHDVPAVDLEFDDLALERGIDPRPAAAEPGRVVLQMDRGMHRRRGDDDPAAIDAAKAVGARRLLDDDAGQG